MINGDRKASYWWGRQCGVRDRSSFGRGLELSKGRQPNMTTPATNPSFRCDLSTLNVESVWIGLLMDLSPAAHAGLCTLLASMEPCGRGLGISHLVKQG